MKVYKISSLLLLILITFNSCNKKSHSYKTNSEFKYEYTFSFDHKDDTSKLKIEKREATKSKISGIVSNGDGDEMPYVFYITPIKTINKKRLETDWFGKFEFEIAAGKYEATVFSMVNDINIERLDFEFEIEENEELIFDIYLKMKPELAIYQINSKIPLSILKVEEIKKCVKENRNKKKGKRCWEKNGDYYISIQI